MDAGLRQEIGEFAREKFTSVIAVERPDDSHGARCARVDERRERGDESANMRWCLRVVAHEMYGFESRMVVDQDQR
eukprot:4474590-Pleurochrysis_carterae.AAC.1